jgi:hypothetical protein
MKMKYTLSSTDEHADVPSGWYGDVGQYLPLVKKAQQAIQEYGLDLVATFWVGEGDGEGFVEPCSHQEECLAKLEGDGNGTDWLSRDSHDYEDRWQGPHMRIYEGMALLYWNAKYHGAEITMDFPVLDMAQENTEAVAGPGQGVCG